MIGLQINDASTPERNIVFNLYQGRLQSCVGTRAKLGYAAFDAQLRKAYFVTTLYAIYDHVSSHLVLEI